MEWFSDLILHPIANIEVEKTLNGNIENQHLDKVCGMCLFFRILINTWLPDYLRITVLYHSII